MPLPHSLRSAATLRCAAVFAGTLLVAACAALGGGSSVPASRYTLAKPDSALLRAAGPDSFTVRFTTSKGPFDVRVHRDWAPNGADRVYYLVRAGFYDDVRFFRTVKGFVSQFGLNGDTAVGRAWRGLRIQDDPTVKSNVRGTLSFAAGGPNTRTTQLYVSYGDNSRLDTMRFAVFGQVIHGMDTVVDSLYNGYGEAAPRGTGPSQGMIGTQGNAYLIRDFPKLDYVITARVIQEWRRR